MREPNINGVPCKDYTTSTLNLTPTQAPTHYFLDILQFNGPMSNLTSDWPRCNHIDISSSGVQIQILTAN